MRSIALLAVWLLTAAPVAAQEGPAPEPITLAEVLAAGRAGSPAIAAARSRERAAAAAAERAGRWTNPSLEFQSENWGAPSPGLLHDTFVTVSQRLETRRQAGRAAGSGARGRGGGPGRCLLHHARNRRGTGGPFPGRGPAP